MKRICLVLLLVLLLAALAVPVSAEELPAAETAVTEEQGAPTEQVEDPRPAWQIYLEDKLYPTVAAVLSGASVAYLLVLPILKKILRSCGVIDSTAGGLLSVSKGAEASGAELAAMRATLAEAVERICKIEEANKELIRLGIKMMSLAFSHESELVQNGTAREIMKAVERYGKEV